MKRSATQPSPEDQAWSWMLTNLLVLPGLGSVLGGRRVGYVQGVLALGGFLLSLIFIVTYVREWWMLRQMPALTARALAFGLGGIALFVSSWLWALMTGLSLLRHARGRGKCEP